MDVPKIYYFLKRSWNSPTIRY